MHKNVVVMVVIKMLDEENTGRYCGGKDMSVVRDDGMSGRASY